MTAEIILVRPFYIVGAVDKPGEYPYRPGMTALEAYAIAGGTRETLWGASDLNESRYPDAASCRRTS